MTAETVAERIQTLKGHICCYTEEEIDALADAIRAELRAQIAADVAHAIDTHVMTWDETTAPHVRKGWRIARSIALDTITNTKEQP